jgi:hypothetical protein
MAAVLSLAAGHYLHWGVVSISLTNALVIVTMIVVFVLAILVPFPHRPEAPDQDEVPGP